MKIHPEVVLSIALLALSTGAFAADSAGKKVFDDVCMPCHGEKGEGTPNLAPALKGSAFVKSTDAKALGAFIRHGRNETEKKFPQFVSVMPPYNGSEEKAEAVANFVKTEIQK